MKEKMAKDFSHKEKKIKISKEDKDKRKKMKKSARTRSAKAGLYFPVGRFHRQLKEEVPRHTRVGATAAVYIGAVVEYLISEVLELSEKQAHLAGKTRIVPRNIFLAVKRDQDLSKFLKATISEAGVVPQYHKESAHDRRR